MWGKLNSLGQACTSPDYILCTKEVQDKFVEEAIKVIENWCGKDPQKCPDLCRIVNATQFQ